MPNRLNGDGSERDVPLWSFPNPAPWLAGERLPPPRIPPGHPGTCCLRCIAVPLEHSCEGCPKLVQAVRDRERLRGEIRAELRREREETKPRRGWRRLITRKDR